MRYQPQGRIQVSRAQPKLQAGFLFAPSGYVNKGQQYPLALTVGAVVAPGSLGLAIDIASTSAQNGATVASGIDFSLQSGGCTLFVVCDGITPGAGTGQGFVGLGGNFFGYNTSGLPILFAGGAIRATSSVAITGNRTYVIAYSYLRGVIAKIYIDGALVASATPAAVGVDYEINLFGHVQATSTHGRHRIYAGALFSRGVLDDDEVARISANPWQLFQAPDEEYESAAAGGGPTTGTFASSLASVNMAASGNIINAGSFYSALDGITMLSSGTVADSPVGGFVSTLAGVTMNATGSQLNAGQFASLMQGANMAASGTVAQHPIGAFASTLSGASMASYGAVGDDEAPDGVVPHRYRWRVMRRHFDN